MKARHATLLTATALVLLAGLDLLTGAGAISLPDNVVFWKYGFHG